MKRTSLTVILILCFHTFLQAEIPVAELKRDKPVDFATEVYPFLKANCLACHNSTKAKADLILESPKDMISGGDSGPAVEPGKAEHSLLFITAAHLEDPVMPPANNKSKAENLTSEQLALLKRWIDEGARGDSVSTKAPEAWSLLTGPQPIFASAVTGDGRYAAVGRGQRIDVYDLRLGRLESSLTDPGLEHPTAHRDLVQALSFSPDGRTLVSGGFRIAKIWKRPEPGRNEPLSLPADPLCFRLSPKKESIAIGLADGTIALIDLKAGKPKPVTYKDHGAAVKDLAFSTDEDWLYSISSDGVLNRRALTKTNVVSSVKLPSPANALAVVNKGRQILVDGNDKQLRLLNSDLSPVKPADPKAQPPVKEVAFFAYPWAAGPAIALKVSNPGGTEFIAAHKDGTVIHSKLEPASPEKAPAEIRKLAHGGEMNQIAVAGERIATAGPTGSVKLWNLADGKLVGELNGDPTVAVKTDRLTREMGVANRIHAYWKKKGPEAEKLWQGESEKAKQAGEAIAKARRDIVAKEEALLEVETRQPPAKEADVEKAREELKRAKQALTSATRNRDASSRLAGEALADQNQAEARSLEAETLSNLLKAEIEAVKKAATEAAPKIASTGLAFSRDGSKLAVAVKDGGIRFWGSETGEWLEDLPGIQSLGPLAISGRGQLLAVEKDRKIAVWNAVESSWALAETLGNGKDAAPFPDRVSAVAFHPTGQKMLIGSGVPSRVGSLTLWDTEEWNLLAENAEAHEDTVTSLAFSPDGSQFVSGGTDRLVKTFFTANLEQDQTFEGHSSHVLDVDWNADNLSLVSCGADLQVKVWDIQAVKEKSKVTGYQKEVSAVFYVADSETVLTASGDKTLKLANKPLPGAGSTFLHTAAVSADGKIIIAGGQDSVLRVWDGKARKLLKEYPVPGEKNLAGTQAAR